MRLINWAPLRDFDRLFDRYAGDVALGRPTGSGEEASASAVWRPSSSIVEDNKRYTVRMDIPGVKREDVSVAVEGDVLVLKGERRVEKSTDDEKEHHREFYYGDFLRRFSLPENVDPSGIKAECKDGVLTVQIPKAEDEKPKSLAIKVH